MTYNITFLAFCQCSRSAYILWYTKRKTEVLHMDYADAILFLFGAIMAFNAVGLIWLCMRLDQIREKIEEVLRWM